MIFRSVCSLLILVTIGISQSHAAITQVANEIVFKDTINKLMVAGDSWTFSNGDTYAGDWLHNKPNGKGIYKCANGDVYKGQFSNGYMDGSGIYEFSNGDVYDGQLVRGLANGQGTLTYENGNRYVGQWQDGLRSGKGKLLFRSGSVFDGHWEQDNKNGKGLMIYRDGQRYIGDYKNNQPHGHGIKTDAYGNTYRGTFSKGLQHGVGECSAKGAVAHVCLFDKGREIRDPDKLELAKAYYEKHMPKHEYKGGIAYQMEDEFTKAREYITTANVWWEKTEALLQTQLRIRSESDDSFLFLVINRYTGPGVYHLRKGEILASTLEGKPIELPDDVLARVEIKRDEKNEVHGTFTIPQLAGENSRRRFRIFDGKFEAKSQPQAPIKNRAYEDFLATGADRR